MTGSVNERPAGERLPGDERTAIRSTEIGNAAEPRNPVQKPTDVRMRGFLSRATVEAAVAWIDRSVSSGAPRGVETVPLRSAAGRILAADMTSEINVPGFARSMMDGYAIRSEETWGATSYNPVRLQIVGEALPGRPFPGHMARGQAVRIMTGTPLPDGADAVLPVEFTEIRGDFLLAAGEVTSGKHVGWIGEDIRAGETILAAGRTLRPQDVGLLSAVGISQLPVIRRPRVRILVTGNEILPAGTPPREYQIADANGPMLEALVHRDGGEVIFAGLIADDPSCLLSALQQPAEIVLVSGGSSVGQEDYLPLLVSQHGELAFHGIAMRPSSPAGMGRMQDALVFLLPGNPVSCLCAYDFFAGRAIRSLGGRSADWPYRATRVVLTRKLVSIAGRVDYARVTLTASGQAEPLAISGAAVLSTTTRADGFVVIPADSEGYPEGAEVTVMLY